MEPKQIGLGIVQVLVFMAFQLGVFNMLGPLSWLLGVIIFSVILYLIGRVSMPRRQPPGLVELWKFTTILAVVLTAIYSLAAPLLGSMMPNISMSQATALTLGFWLVIFGAAMFVTGWTTKWGVTTAVGVIWALSGLIYAVVGGNYFDFALITGFPFIVYGFITKG